MLAMANWSARQIFVLMLAVFVTLGLSFSVVEASGMVGKMTMSTQMGAPGHGDCHGCSGDEGKGRTMPCASSICTMSFLAILPQTAQVVFVGTSISSPGSHTLPHGISYPPDPYPPRLILLG
jgi:hypothetical protein